MSPVVLSVLPAPGAVGLPAGRWICAVRPPRHRGGAAFLASAAGSHVRHGGLVLERSVGCVRRLGRCLSAAWDFSAAPKERCPMETISYTLPPEQDGATVRHILKAALHVSSHAISRLTRTENGIRVNGIHARTSGYPSHRRRAGGGDQRPPSAPGAPRRRGPGPCPSSGRMAICWW